MIAINFCQRWALNLGFYTTHPGQNNRAPGTRLNRTNPGAGLVCNLNRYLYLDVDYISENSHRGKLATAGIGALFPVARFRDYTASFGAEAVGIDYEMPGKRRWVGAVPALLGAIEKEGWNWRPMAVAFPGIQKPHRMRIVAASFFLQYRF